MSQPFIALDPRHPSADFNHQCAITVMAKAPVAGRVKTRLSPPLTPQQAAELNACFLRDTVLNLAEATAVSASRWVVSYTPSGDEASFEGILPAGALLLPQRGSGFGERLLHTAEDLFACGFSSVCLIDSDSPTVPTSAFIRAARELAVGTDRLVIGPSDDGGYYLLGLNRPHEHLFENISWSTGAVAQQTLERAKHLGLPAISLASWYDVDDARSLSRLRRELFSDGADASSELTAYPAPFTRAYLHHIRFDTDGLSDAQPNKHKTTELASF